LGNPWLVVYGAFDGKGYIGPVLSCTCSRMCTNAMSNDCEYDGPHITSEIRNLLNMILLVVEVDSRSALAQGTPVNASNYTLRTPS
jgi:hypothetical protein